MANTGRANGIFFSLLATRLRPSGFDGRVGGPPKLQRRRVRYSLLALAVVAATNTTAHAQGWPQRPVKMLVPFAAGGNIDVMGRLAASRLSETLGQQFVVENRVGGNGVIAAEAVARATPDGYSLLWA